MAMNHELIHHFCLMSPFKTYMQVVLTQALGTTVYLFSLVFENLSNALKTEAQYLKWQLNL